MKVIPCDASLPVVLGSFLWCWCRDAGAAFICVGSVLGLHRISALKKYSITSFRTRRTHLLPETVIGTYSRGVQRQPFHHVYRVFPQEHYTLQRSGRASIKISTVPVLQLTHMSSQCHNGHGGYPMVVSSTHPWFESSDQYHGTSNTLVTALLVGGGERAI
ncbi:hypothetical protein PISMIDRAFT_598783 [Pisolithus microcarpus 441]|uniref:Uncharacterized protein n=1 Tax=Pisolithus microcarpus 441 TaxID=765257 RepID=A0A0C9Y094_9AGAM|nr:hypothetical protein BKA83DRAFT_598783 [Pisolithus microcarpus]KIK10596.1 hypothetical protein PISMIDRAFT_598783 [Pisolithus microcarpus 441]